MKILIGYDGSECADAAIGDLSRAGLPSIAEVHILTVAEVWLPPPDSSRSTQTSSEDSRGVESFLQPMYAKARLAVQEAQNLASRASSRVATLFPGWSVAASASYGSAAWEIVFRADKWQPDLVVVGSHGHSALGRFVLGSVSQVVLTEAQCSVRIARGRVEEPGTPVRILVGIDGSNESEAVVREVATRSWPAHTQVKLVVVDDPISVSFVADDFPPIVAEPSDHEWAEKILADNFDVISNRSDIEVTTQLIAGNPKTELLAAAESWRADCIFVGSSGSSNRSSRFVLGSVSAAVASRAHCSVEVVRIESDVSSF